MKKLPALLTLIGFLLPACTFNVEVLTPEALTGEVLTPTGAVVTAPASSATATAPASKTPTSVLPAAQFSNARFTVDVSQNIYQSIFPARTRSVYAVWDYQNMRAGMMIRRDWYYNDMLWITREEPWDFSKYGANGSVHDISVYDLDRGLESGKYRLEMYIDMQPQPIGEVTWPEFTIVAQESDSQLISPNGQWVAEVNDPRILSIRDKDNKIRQLFNGNEITNLTWLPDNRHILFVDRDRSQQVDGLKVGIRDDLWIVKVVSGEPHLLYKNTTLFGKLVLSPNVHYIASIEGSGLGDACAMDKRLIFIELSSDYQFVKIVQQSQFIGISVIPDVVVYPAEMGVWKNDSKFDVTLAGTCNADQSLFGDYLFDLRSLKAVKSGQ